MTDTDNHRIQRFTPEGDYIATWGTADPSDAPGDFRRPVGILVVGDAVYVTDQGNNRVQVIDIDGNVLNTWGEKGEADGQFNAPTGIAQDNDGYIQIVDILNRRVQVFTLEGAHIRTWNGSGTAAGPFTMPVAVTVFPRE
ncbi:MAG: hypothetical protein R2849_22500 [Thermomicrobiales bacterium]